MATTASNTPALEISNLEAWYGESHVLHGVDIVVQPGEVVTLLGRNGAGRTTTMRAVMGLTGARKGSVKINGVETIHMPTHRIAHLGVGYCPEERGIFSSLSCEENLLLPPALKTGTQGMGHEDVDRVTQLIKKVSAGRTILMVEHNMKVISTIADRITVLQRGAVLAEGAYEEVSNNPQVMEAYMGTTDGQLQGAH